MALTKMQTLILWALIARPGAGALAKEIKPEVKKPDRDALEKAGLLEVSKRGRAFWLEVSDRGWDWAGENLDAALPSGSTAGCEILRAWLTRLKVLPAGQEFCPCRRVRAQPGASGGRWPRRCPSAFAPLISNAPGETSISGCFSPPCAKSCPMSIAPRSMTR